MAVKEIEKVEKQKAVGPWRIAWDRFRKNRIAVVGATLFIIIVLSVIFVPILSPYDISEFDLQDKELPPSAKHWLGTDEQGRDVMLRLFTGGRISILVGLMAAGVSVTLGSIIGGMAGYYGGRVDNLLMRFAEIIYSIPFTPTVISISAALMWKVSSDKKMFFVMLLIGILSWPGRSESRNSCRRLKCSEYPIDLKLPDISFQTHLLS